MVCKSGGKTAALQKLFKPFVKVHAFGIFPGGAGEEVEMADEDLRIDFEQPFGFARGRLRLAVGGFFRRVGGGLFRLFDPTHFQGLVVNFLQIHEGDAAKRGRELRACGLKCSRQGYLRSGIRG